jgi:ATP-dependent Clp protease adaptor protein ClpS
MQLTCLLCQVGNGSLSFAAPMAKNETIFQDTTKSADKEVLQEPPLYKVLLHNDDYTTMDFVVMILQTIFCKNTEEATRIMLNVHHRGIGVAGIYTREIGETKVAIVHKLAKRHQFPLKCTLEKDG